jgi:hypothetical protein
MGWRRRTVEGFGRFNAASGAAGMLTVLAVHGWRVGDATLVTAAWTAAAAIAAAAAVWAFRVDAARAFGPPGSPERRRRRLTSGQLARDLGAGLLVGCALAVLLRFTRDDPPPALAYQLVFVVLIGLLYGVLFAWQRWATVDDQDTTADTEAIPARSVPRPVADPPRDRGVDIRRGAVVCLLLAVLGVLSAVEGFVGGDGQQAGVGLGLSIGSIALLVWAASRSSGDR